MKTTRNFLTVIASAALLYGLGTATAMAGPHPANSGNMTRTMSSVTRTAGQQQTARTMTRATHNYRTETRTQADRGTMRVNAVHSQTRKMSGPADHGTAAGGSSHATRSMQQHRMAD